jgi:hypothetical protein
MVVAWQKLPRGSRRVGKSCRVAEIYHARLNGVVSVASKICFKLLRRTFMIRKINLWDYLMLNMPSLYLENYY